MKISLLLCISTFQCMKFIIVHYLENFHTTLLLVWLVSCRQFSDTSLLMCQPEVERGVQECGALKLFSCNRRS